jgi:pyruvate-formate lyase-activating enzyme
MVAGEKKNSPEEICRLDEQGFSQASCSVQVQGKTKSACRATLKRVDGIPHRLIESAHLSRPEHYFSIYQSGCNLSCKKCHSWEFTQRASGDWMSPDDIAKLAHQYSKQVTYHEPKERATSYHALELCRSCGKCMEIGIIPIFEKGRLKEKHYLKPSGKISDLCPKNLKPDQILLSPQGLGPARNIIAFTGGDLSCHPKFYVLCSEKIKKQNPGLWILHETNGYALTPLNLELFRNSGIDAFWLDIKAYDNEVHKKLTGVSNEWVLKLPEEMLRRDFVLEVLSLYIPGWVETDQIENIANLLAELDENIPFTILAFFPQHEMKDVTSPTLDQMLSAYDTARAKGLKHVRMGNTGVFCKTDEDYKRLATLAPEGW